jgi:hypothetical protein
MRAINPGDIHPRQQQLLQQLVLPNDARIQRHHDSSFSSSTRTPKQGPASLGQQGLRFGGVGSAEGRLRKAPTKVLHHVLETGQDVTFETSQRGKANFRQLKLQILQIVVAQREVGEQIIPAASRVGIL